MKTASAAEISRDDIARAAGIIRAGGLVAMPTETVYGLAADATNERAVAKIFEAKGRPRFNPLIVHVADMAMAEALADFPPLARRLADAFWPGPLSLVLARRAGARVSLLVSAGLETIALRIPAHDDARALIEAAGRPLAAPSANRSGAVSPTRPEHVAASLGGAVDMILDGGPTGIGLESTIVKIDGDRAVLLRPGGLAAAAIEAAAGAPLARPAENNAENNAASGGVEAPGMLASHYAPRARLRLGAKAPHTDEAFLAFGPAPTNHPYTLSLSETGDLGEAAANLFAHLHALDALAAEKGLAGLAAAPVPMEGLGEAINDRLARAAAPRPA